MPNHPSAHKRHRQNLKRRAVNREARSTIRTAVKAALSFAEKADFPKAEEAAKIADRLLSKAAIHGLVHKKNAQRRIGRLAQRISIMQQAHAKRV